MESRLDAIIKWAKGPKVLHIGCADHEVRKNSKHWVHERLYKRFSYVVGIDISEKNIQIMRNYGYENLYIANAENFFIEENFDTIIAGELIEHLSNPGLFLFQVNKHLKRNGRLIITTPSPFSLINIAYAWLKYPKTCQNSEHAMWFCPRTLKSLVIRYGFKEEYFSMIQDYELDNLSIKYRVLSYIMVYLRWLFPKKLKCNCMLSVMNKIEDQ
jgi:2-polyprenyl-3-methyl-5-hydroxy-6-metoxy-1,4-benzoquinol methylase